jgi:hypothetical protein
VLAMGTLSPEPAGGGAAGHPAADLTGQGLLGDDAGEGCLYGTPRVTDRR